MSDETKCTCTEGGECICPPGECKCCDCRNGGECKCGENCNCPNCNCK